MSTRNGRKSAKPTPYEVVAAYGDMLAQWPWTHFATLTFAFPVNEATAKRQFYRWIRRLEQRSQQRVGFFGAPEQSPGGLLHLHALIAAPIASSGLREAWPGGWAEVSSYDRERGARFYVAKSLATAQGDPYFRFPALLAA